MKRIMFFVTVLVISLALVVMLSPMKTSAQNKLNRWEQFVTRLLQGLRAGGKTIGGPGMIKFSGKEWIFSDNDSDPASIVCLTVANVDSKVFSVEGNNLSVDIQPYETKTLCTELSQVLGQHYVDGELQDKVIAVTPNGTMMTPAMKELELRLLNKKVNHGNNPVLRWMADNLAVRETATGLRMPDKAESQGKIDGIVALLISLDRLMRHPLELQTGSKYEREGLAVV